MSTNKGTRQKVTRVFSCLNESTVGVLSVIEVSITPGLPIFEVIGLCDSTIRESRGRIQAALISSGYDMPKGHITVSISPAYMHKKGSSFDLPIALGILVASGQVPNMHDRSIYAEGELSLTGEILATPGATARLMALGKSDFSTYDRVIIPQDESQAAGVARISAVAISHLSQVVDVMDMESVDFNEVQPETSVEEVLDFSAVKGQEKAMRALMIAACGYHSILLLGSPGCGKTTAASVIRGILPPLNYQEMADVYMIKETAGIGNDDGKALTITDSRPFRRIYPGMTPSRVIGSFRSLSAGELVLGNHGVVFADEICEFPLSLIDCLRLPMEEHVIRMRRDGRDFIFPAEFLFIGAGNPCRCGMYYESGSKCVCTPQVRKRYISRISGPFADRIDLYTEMRSITGKDMKSIGDKSEARLNEECRRLVKACWDIQDQRYAQIPGVRFNGTLDLVDSEILRASSSVLQYASDISEQCGFSARGYTKLLRVGRTIADMRNAMDVNCDDISEAAMFRLR